MKFVVLGDLHYTDYTDPATRAVRDNFFRTLFNHLAGQSPDLVFAIGDIVHNGTHNEIQGLYRLAEEAGLNLICTTGNHDTASLPKRELRPYFVGGQAETEDELYHAFSQAGVRFVLLDTGREMLCDIDWSGYVSPRQREWLAGQLADFQAGHTTDHSLVVLGHHPIYDTTEFSREFRLNIDNSEEVRQTFGEVRPGRAFYVCGHNHTHSLTGPDAAGWTYIQCGAPLVAFSYRLITLDETGSRVETVNFGLDTPTLRESLPPVYAGLEHFADLSVEQAGGQPADREWRWRVPSVAAR